MAVDLVLALDRSSPVPLREQIAEALRRAVRDGRLRAGEMVPTTRALAAHLGVARGTVVAAMDQVVGEGYFESRVGVGTVVTAEMEQRPVRAAAPASRAGPVAPPAVDLRPGHTWTAGLADAAWDAAWRTASRLDPPGGAVDPDGEPALRTALAEHVRRARGVAPHPDDVVVTAGTSDAFLLLALTLRRLHPEPVVAMEEPGYGRARLVLTAAGVRVVPVALDDEGSLAPTALEAVGPVHAVLVTPSHQYPLGGRMSVQTRLDLLAWAAGCGAIVLEDDYDSEFRHGRMPLPALASLAEPGRVVLIGTLSKVLAPALRTGYVIADGGIGEEVRRTRRLLDPPVSWVQQRALAAYIDSGGLARRIARARREYGHRRARLHARLDPLPGVLVSATDGGLHAVVRTPVPAARLRDALADRGFDTALLSDYSTHRPGPEEDALVVGYGAATVLDLERALDSLEALLRARPGPQQADLPRAQQEDRASSCAHRGVSSC